MGYSKDIERLARSLHGQKLEPEYIRHYLIETYALDSKTVDQIFERLSIPKKSGQGKGKSATQADAKSGKPERGEAKPPGQGFY
jgi:hypothetical protein